MSKSILRKKAREKRKELGTDRRLGAADKLIEILLPRLQGPTLSFASFGDEIDLWPLNALLSEKKILLLPGADHEKLEIFSVGDLSGELVKTQRGWLAPNEGLCSSFPLSEVGFVLVPALAFDRSGGRIGYGGGFYDRLLAKTNAHKIGVGFIEQVSSEDLPHEAHDIRVDELVLV